MKIFIDVGSHFGETLNEVRKDKYGFDIIYSIEPSKKCIKNLQAIKDHRLNFFNFGLSNSNKEVQLYNSGLAKASIYTNKKNNNYEIIKLVKASEWFKKYIKHNNIVVVKLNCEGSECDIVEDLILSNEIYKIYNILITFDVRFFDQVRQRELEVRKKLKNIKLYNHCYSDDVMKGSSHNKRIENWLKIIGANRNFSNLVDIRKEYFSTLKIYSNKSGFVTRLESNFKRVFFYNKYPKIIKFILQYLKRSLGLSREHPK